MTEAERRRLHEVIDKARMEASGFSAEVSNASIRELGPSDLAVEIGLAVEEHLAAAAAIGERMMQPLFAREPTIWRAPVAGTHARHWRREAAVQVVETTRTEEARSPMWRYLIQPVLFWLRVLRDARQRQRDVIRARSRT